MQDVLENDFAQRETQIDPWRKQWLSVENYGLVRAAEDMMYDLQIGAIFYSRLLKKNVAVEIIPKEEQGWKNTRKPVGWHLKICKQCTANVEMKGLLRSLHNHRLHLWRSPVRTSDHYGSNFSYNSQVLRRKHPSLGIKLNPLSLFFQLARYHRNNTNKRP